MDIVSEALSKGCGECTLAHIAIMLVKMLHYHGPVQALLCDAARWLLAGFPSLILLCAQLGRSTSNASAMQCVEYDSTTGKRTE